MSLLASYFSAGVLNLSVLGHLLAHFEPHVGLLPIRAVTGEPAAAAELAHIVFRPDVVNLDFEKRLDSGLDLRLIGVCRHFEAERPLFVLLLNALLGDDRPFDDVVYGHGIILRRSLTREPRSACERQLR